MIDKNEALSQYISEYPQLYGWLYFNTIIQSSGETSLMTDSDNIINEFIDSSKQREYIFSIVMLKDYDRGTSDLNIEALRETQNFNDWISTQNDIKNFPDWGNNNIINDINILSSLPMLRIDQDTNVAEYMLQLKINYLEKGK